MYADLSLNEIGAKLNFSSNLLSKKKSQKLDMKIFIENSKNCFCIRYRTLRIIWDQKLNLAIFEGGEGH